MGEGIESLYALIQTLMTRGVEKGWSVVELLLSIGLVHTLMFIEA